MRIASMIVLCAACIAVSCVQLAARVATEDRPVEVTVTVHSVNNTPVSNVIVIIEVPPNSFYAAKTNLNGVANVAARVPIGDTTAFASLAEETDKIEYADHAECKTAYATAIEQAHFKDHYAIAIGSAESVASLLMVGQECVSITLHAPAASPRRKFSAGCRPALAQPISALSKPDIVVKGVQKGVPAMLVISNANRPNMRVIELNAQETQNNLVIDNITLPADDGSEEVTIRITDRAELTRRPFVVTPLITLISSDAAQCFYGLAQVSGNGLVVNLTTLRPRLHPGRYVVVPGLLGSDQGPGAVYGHMKTTGQIPAGIPYIDVVAGGANEFQIQGVPAREASLALPAYP